MKGKTEGQVKLEQFHRASLCPKSEEAKRGRFGYLIIYLESPKMGVKDIFKRAAIYFPTRSLHAHYPSDKSLILNLHYPATCTYSARSLSATFLP